MRIAIVHRFFWRPGAVPAVARGWADHLEAAGHRVVALASDVDPAASTERRTYARAALPHGKPFDLAGWVFAAGVLAALLRRRQRPHAILCTDSTAYFGAWLAGRLLRAPAIMAFQGWVYSPGKRGVYPRTVAWMYKLSLHFAARHAPLVGCLNCQIRDGLRALGTPPRRLWYAPNCVDLDLWRSEKDGAHQRDRRQVLYVGGFREEKGIGVLAEAIPLVARRRPEARFRILGGEEPADGPVHRRLAEAGALASVDFGGLVPREELGEAYAQADVLATPSLAEGHPLAPLECLACGTPVVATAIPGLDETIEDGANGLLVPPGDAQALADALCRVLGDPALLDRLSRAARPSVERFDWAARVRELERRIEALRRGA